MPQLVPFYFVNEVTFTFLTLIVMMYLFSKYMLPSMIRLFSTRLYMSKL